MTHLTNQPASAAAAAADTAARFRAVRDREFPWTREHLYLNNASIGPLPERTRRVLDAFTARRAAPHGLSDADLAATLRQAREVAARLVGADVSEIALTSNTSYGLNIAAAGLPLERGDTVVLPDQEFPANVYPWLRLARRGIRVERIPATARGWPDEERLLARLDDPTVRLLTVSLVQFHNGYRVDLARLSEACRAQRTYLVVDAIQGLGQVPVDVRRTPVDVLACGGQKWLLSPWGSGFVYVRRGLLDTLDPPVTGWMAFEGTDDFTRLTEYRTRLRPDARRYELVTLPFQDFAGFTESVRLLLELGIERIAAHLAAIRQPLLARAARGTLRLDSPTDAVHGSAILGVRTADTQASYRRLKEAGVTCALREGTIRLSPHFYNTVEEIERVADLLETR